MIKSIGKDSMSNDVIIDRYEGYNEEFDLDSFNSIHHHDFNEIQPGHVPAVTPSPQHHPTVSLAAKMATPHPAHSAKKEIQLPKTRVSSRGQLFLSTGDRKQATNAKLGKTAMTRPSETKSYAKKWIEDISSNMTVDPADLLDEHLHDELSIRQVMMSSNTTPGKLGKNVDYFINDVRTKSGKGRNSTKAHYLDFMPDDFDSKNELEAALRELNLNSKRATSPKRVQSGTTTMDARTVSGFSLSTRTNTALNSHTRHSPTSAAADANKLHEREDTNSLLSPRSTDDAEIEKKSTLSKSRLSSHPVLSVQELIDKLKCKTIDSTFISIPPNSHRADPSLKTSPSRQQTAENSPSQFETTTVKYKEHFVFDEEPTYDSKSQEKANQCQKHNTVDCQECDKQSSSKLLKKRTAQIKGFSTTGPIESSEIVDLTERNAGSSKGQLWNEGQKLPKSSPRVDFKTSPPGKSIKIKSPTNNNYNSPNSTYIHGDYVDPDEMDDDQQDEMYFVRRTIDGQPNAATAAAAAGKTKDRYMITGKGFVKSRQYQQPSPTRPSSSNLTQKQAGGRGGHELAQSNVYEYSSYPNETDDYDYHNYDDYTQMMITGEGYGHESAVSQQHQQRHQQHPHSQHQIFNNEAYDDGTQPITISITQIDHEKSGKTIRVRKFFDRRVLNIKQKPIYQIVNSNSFINNPALTVAEANALNQQNFLQESFRSTHSKSQSPQNYSRPKHGEDQSRLKASTTGEAPLDQDASAKSDGVKTSPKPTSATREARSRLESSQKTSAAQSAGAKPSGSIKFADQGQESTGVAELSVTKPFVINRSNLKSATASRTPTRRLSFSNQALEQQIEKEKPKPAAEKSEEPVKEAKAEPEVVPSEPTNSPPKTEAGSDLTNNDVAATEQKLDAADDDQAKSKRPINLQELFERQSSFASSMNSHNNDEEAGEKVRKLSFSSLVKQNSGTSLLEENSHGLADERKTSPDREMESKANELQDEIVAEDAIDGTGPTLSPELPTMSPEVHHIIADTIPEESTIGEIERDKELPDLNREEVSLIELEEQDLPSEIVVEKSLENIETFTDEPANEQAIEQVAQLEELNQDDVRESQAPDILDTSSLVDDEIESPSQQQHEDLERQSTGLSRKSSLDAILESNTIDQMPELQNPAHPDLPPASAEPALAPPPATKKVEFKLDNEPAEKSSKAKQEPVVVPEKKVEDASKSQPKPALEPERVKPKEQPVQRPPTTAAKAEGKSPSLVRPMTTAGSKSAPQTDLNKSPVRPGAPQLKKESNAPNPKPSAGARPMTTASTTRKQIKAQRLTHKVGFALERLKIEAAAMEEDEQRAKAESEAQALKQSMDSQASSDKVEASQTVEIDVLSKIDELLGIKKEKLPEPIKPKKVVNLGQEKTTYPYLQIPWNHKNPIVDLSAYRNAFQIPDLLNPKIYHIDPAATSIEELVLERRVLEDKITELRTSKLGFLDKPGTKPKSEGKSKGKAGKSKKAGKKAKRKKSMQSAEQKQLIEQEMKEHVIKTERTRLRNEALKKQLEVENFIKLLNQNISEKDIEIENLRKELDVFTKDYDEQSKSISEQLKYLETNEDQIRDALVKSKNLVRDELEKSQIENRQVLRKRQQDLKEDQIFKFEIKRKELDWLLQMYTEADEIERVKEQLTELRNEQDSWLRKFELDIEDEERELDRREEEDDIRLSNLEQEEEENALGSLKREQFELMNQRKNLVEHYEEMKNKITARLEAIEVEKLMILKEKQTIDENTQKSIELQRAKLLEIMQAEQEARLKIKDDLDLYHRRLLKIREKNMDMRCSLALMRHTQAVSKAHSISYLVDWPIDKFIKQVEEKNKTARPN